MVNNEMSRQARHDATVRHDGRTWRKFAVAILSLLLFATLTFAFVKIIPARAETDLDSCTADYEIVEDESNLWYQEYGASWRLGPKPQQDDATGDQRTILVKITKAGEFVCGWAISRQQENPDTSLNYNSKPVKDVQFQLLVYQYSDKNDKGEPILSDRNGGPTRATSPSLSQTTEFRQNVEEGDYLEFRFENYSYEYGTECYLFFKAPQNKAHISASVADDCQEGGFIKSDFSSEHSGQEVKNDTYDVVWGETFALTAVAADGYTFSYWSDEKGLTVGGLETYSTTVLGENNNKHYYAHFVKNDEEGLLLAPSKRGNNAQWTESEVNDGKRYTLVRDQWTTPGDVAALKLDFFASEGGIYLEFDYFNNISSASASIVVKEWTKKEGYSSVKRLTSYGSKFVDERLMKGCIFFGTPGFHHVELSLDYPNSSPPFVPSETDKVIIGNVSLCKHEQLTFEDVTLDIPEYFNMTMSYDGLQEPVTLTHSENVAHVPLGLAVNFKYTMLQQQKPSALDPEQQVKLVFKNFTGNFESIDEESQPWDCTTSSFSMTTFEGAVELGSGRDLRLYTYTGDEIAPHIAINYTENAPQLRLSAIKTIDSEETEIESIEDGQVIDFPFLHNNSLSLRIQKIEGLAQTDFSVLVNNVEQNTALREYEDVFLLPIQDVGNTQIVIRYAKSSETIDFSAYSLSFRLGEYPEDDEAGTDISKTVHLDENSGSANLKIAYNRPPTWLFDPELSEKSNYAYTTTSQLKFNPANGYYQGKSNLDYLTFSLSGEVQGSLTFQFRASGYIGTTISGQYRGGLLCAAPQSAVTLFSMSYSEYCQSKDGIAWTDPNSDVTLLAKPNVATGMEYGSTVVPLDDGWYEASIPIKQSEPIYLILATYYPTDSSYPIDQIPIASASIRDVRVVTGEKSVSLSMSAEAGEATATVTVNGVQHHSGEESFKVIAGTMVNLSIDANGKKFYGWSVNGQLVSTEEEASIFINADSEIKAWIADEGIYAARTEGTFYTSIETAVKAAKSGQTVIVIKDGATIEESFEIKTGVTLLLPYSNENKLTATGTPDDVNSKDRIAWIADSDKYRYLTVTVNGSATITVNGTLAVGGVVNYPKGQGYQGHTSGAYSHLVNNGTILVENGGLMDVYGRVTGTGSINVASGAKLYEPFLILDYTGGSNALGLFMAGQTPFRRYAMINIECPMTIHYGGQLYGHASLWIETFKMLASLDQPFISYDMGGKKGGDGNGNDTFVMLHKGASVKITYDPAKVISGATVADCTEGIGKTTMTFEGGATFSYMLFSAMGISVPTNPVYFSIPYNYEVHMTAGEKSGEGVDETYNKYETVTDFMIMPGAVVEVGENATLTLNANTLVYDGLKQNKLSGKGYPTVEQLNGIYSKSGNLIVNGTLEIGMKTTVQPFTLFEPSEPFVPKVIGATFLGIIQTDGTGTITIPQGAVLSGDIIDGAEGTNYFSYTTTARVWDRAHGCFGNLQAGKTYTAKSGVEFTLDELKYSAAPGVAESQTLSLNQTMKGSWRVEHLKGADGADIHHEPQESEWVYDEDKDGTVELGGHKTIHRYCTELGCEEKEYSRELLGMPGTKEVQDLIGGLTFKGPGGFGSEAIDKLIGLFKGNYDDFDFAGMTVTAESNDIVTAWEANAKGNYYEVVITLKGGFILQDGKFTQTLTLKWQITPFDISVNFGKDGANATASLNESSVTYDGNEHKIGVASVLAKLTKVGGSSDNSLGTSDYDVSYSTDLIHAGTVTVTITGKGNYTGKIELPYEIVAKKVNLKLIKQTATYSGTMPAIDSSQYTTGDILKSDEGNVTITLKFVNEGGPWNVGQYTLTATLENMGGHENYVLGTVEGTNVFEIMQKSIQGGEIALKDGPYTYNGCQQTPFASFTLTDFEDLQQGRDYEVSYSDNTNAGNGAKVIVRGKGNFTGEVTVTFTIGKFSLEDESVTATVVGDSFTYKGEAWTPDVTVTSDEVIGGITFDKQYESNTNAGTAHIILTGTGNFEGEKTVEFTIGKAKITVKAQDQRTTQGDDITSDFDFVIIDGLNFESDHELLKGYFTYSTNATSEEVNTEGFDITISLKGGQPDNYEVTISETKGKYYIDESIYKDVRFEGLQVTYNGETQTFKVVQDIEGAVVTLTLEGKPFEGEKDANKYTVSVRIHVEGHNDYTGEVTFEILAKDIEGAEIALDGTDLTYTGKEITPKVTGVTVDGLHLTAEEYADVKYANNTNAGEASVTVTASGNFTGTVQKQFTIQPRNIAGAHVTADGTFTYNGAEQTPQLTVTLAVDGAEPLTLIAEKDFTAKYTNNKNAGMAGVTLTGQTNFTGTMSEEELFEIKAKPITVTIHGQTFIYAGTKAPALAQSAWSVQGLCGDDHEADLQVVLSLIAHEGNWNVGTYAEAIQGVSANANYAVTFTYGTLTITKRGVTVEIADKESEYGDDYAALTFEVDGGTPLGEGDTDDDLEIALKFEGSQGARLGAGEYSITGTASAANYTVTFRGSKGTAGTYTVSPRKITITIKNQSSVYDNAEPQVEQTAWEVTGDRQVMTNAQGTADNLAVELAKAPGKDVLKDGYAITGKWHNDNYKVEWVNGTYTIEAREVTVEILDQRATYDYHETKEYAFDGTKWQVDAETLAPDEEKSVLGVTLTKPNLSDANAGAYEITGKWNNTNYAVSFAGSFEGRGGTYTIDKLDISDDAVFILGRKDGGVEEKDGSLWMRFAGKALELTGDVTFFTDKDKISFAKTDSIKINPAALEKVGNYQVTVSIEDANFMGSAVFEVVVTNENGYTERLEQTLARLRELKAGLTKETLQAKDFAALKEMSTLIAALDEEELNVASEELAEYETLMEYWNDAADIGTAIETAEKIGDAPIEALFGAVAALTALCGLAYIAMKGGML